MHVRDVCLTKDSTLGAGLVPPGPLGGLVKSISAAQVRGPKHTQVKSTSVLRCPPVPVPISALCSAQAPSSTT